VVGIKALILQPEWPLWLCSFDFEWPGQYTVSDRYGHEAVNGTNSTNVRSRHGDQIATNRRSSDRPFQAISTC
jgi:hypothetical protein